MRTIESDAHRPIKLWADHVRIEPQALDQLRRVAELPIVHSHVAVMPDAHHGIGCTVGSVIATRRAVIPAAVGVDLGCGMIAASTNLRAGELPDSLGPLRSAIERAVPHGRTNNGGPGDRGAWHNVPKAASAAFGPLAARWKQIQSETPEVRFPRVPEQLGTLGGGNHFIELCLDESDRVWLMLHSGSRGVGNRIGTVFIGKAKEEAKRNDVHLPDADLAFLREGSEVFDAYWRALSWAQDYARVNRECMLEAALGALRTALPHARALGTVVACHHNYASREHHFGADVVVTRKGAVSARAGELGIIPGAMGRKSFIVRGRGNADSFCSCSHGAGRAMSRGEAKRRFSVADHARETQGLECRKDANVIDETPLAYKPIDDVMASQADLVEVVTTLRAVLCVKG